jgi:hypothetical protein
VPSIMELQVSHSKSCILIEGYPLRGLQRHQAPRFTPGEVKPWAGSRIDGKRKAVMVATLTPRHRVGKTPHSKRVWVARAGRALRASDARIQAFVR